MQSSQTHRIRIACPFCWKTPSVRREDRADRIARKSAELDLLHLIAGDRCFLAGESQQLLDQAHGPRQTGFQLLHVIDSLRILHSRLEILELQIEGDAAVLLDLGLPRRSGLEVLRRVRAEGDRTPMLILTARDALDDRIAGLDLGADDYLVKPFDLRELLARMRDVIRRISGHAQSTIGTERTQLDLEGRALAHAGTTQTLSAREFHLMHALLERPGAILSRAQLEERIYGWGEEVSSNAVEVLIHGVRRKFDADVIRNIRGLGWRVYALAAGDHIIQTSQQKYMRSYTIRRQTLLSGLPVALLIPISAYVLWMSICFALRPLDAVAQAATTRNEHDLRALPTEDVPCEVLPLVAAMNRLLLRLNDDFEAQRRFVQDAAHELRTPITSCPVQAHPAPEPHRQPNRPQVRCPPAPGADFGQSSHRLRRAGYAWHRGW
jgi:two-component system OmpR family response regulator/two-component system response regulator QseB